MQFDNIIICGDFNINIMEKTNQTLQFLALLLSYNLKPTICTATRTTANSATCIDNIFTNISGNATACNVPIDFSDHDAQILELANFSNDASKNNTTITKCVRKFSKPNINKFIDHVSKINWQPLYSQQEDKMQLFYKILNPLFDHCFPRKKVKIEKLSKNWITKGIKISSKNKRELYIIYKNFPNQILKAHYNKYSYILKQVVEEAKRKHIDNLIQNSSNIKKSTWTVINKEINRNKKITTNANITIQENKNTISDPKIIVQKLNHYFEKSIEEVRQKLPSPTSQIHYPQPHTNNTLFLSPTTKYEIENLIKSLKNTNAQGLDGYPVKIIKATAGYLSEPLSHIINHCLQTGKFPNILKIAKVVPLPKCQTNNDITNFRPISILPAVSKIFELTIKNRVIAFFEKHNVICQSQHGYQASKSTHTALQNLLAPIYTSLSKNKLAASINCDLSKAFDLIDHEILIRKLQAYGIRGIALALITSYLTDRKQYTEISHTNRNTNYNYASSIYTIKCGVPQGSILGPLLFNVYVNDLPAHISSKSIMYADDLSISIEAENESHLESEIKKVLTQVTEWYASNKLIININKTNILFFSSNKNLNRVRDKNFNIHFVESSKLLGLHIDADLKWKSHCENLLYKLNKALYAMRRLKMICNYTTLKAVYHAYFESILKYGILFWGNTTHMQDILKIQKKAIRLLTNSGPRDSCRTKFSEIGVLSAPNLYIYESAIYIKSNLRQFMTSSDCHNYNIRTNNVRLLESKNNKIYNSFLNTSAKIFNNIVPTTVDMQNDNVFRKTLKKHLLGKAYYSISEFFERTITI